MNARPLVDTHCHLDDPDLLPEVAGVLDRARQAGVGWCIAIGAGRGTESAPAAVALAHTYEEVAACVGIHPNDADCATDAVMATLLELALDGRVVGIGETGLDYRTDPSPEVQREAFRRSIRIARKAQKPLVIHTRAAGRDTLEILREEDAQVVGGVIHSCTEDVAFVRHALDLDFDIALSPLMETHEHARAIARLVPRDRLLLETSAPFHPPKARPGRNEPAFLTLVAEHVASLLEIGVRDLLEETSANAIRRFGLDGLPGTGRASLTVVAGS
jgi:TatD DNase family protein